MTSSENTEAHIYGALITSRAFGQKPAVCDMTDAIAARSFVGFSIAESGQHFISHEPILMHDTLNDLLNRNSEPTAVSLPPSFEQPHWLTVDRYNELLRTHRPGPRIKELYPDTIGLLRFSRPGISPDRTQALIYACHFADSLAGRGDFVLLERANDSWNIIKKHLIWIS